VEEAGKEKKSKPKKGVFFRMDSSRKLIITGIIFQVMLTACNMMESNERSLGLQIVNIFLVAIT
jgi:hypothetical protein